LAKKKPAASNSKSDSIREVMAAKPKATVKEIKAELDARGVAVSVALINKLKYDRNRGGAKGKKSRRTRSGGSKADAIRAKFDQLGYDARPRDIIAALKSEGVKVTSAQVSMLRAKLSTNGKASKTPVSASSVPFEHLVAAKQLADRLGGINKARAALESFAKLVSG
jgi:hypothetical protein